MKYYLAIDIGASSGRHILAHVEGDRLVTEEIYRFQNAPLTLTEGGRRTLKWDIDRLYDEILNGLAKAGELGKIPATVGIDTWGVDYVLLDEAGSALPGGAFCYRDARTDATVPAVHEKMPFAELFAKTGIMFNSFNTVYQLEDDRRTGRLDRAAALLMMPDYFHYRLTGKRVQEYTNATTTGMVNAQTHTWDADILKTLGYPARLFGELTQPGTPVGAFTDEVAKRVGYRATVMLPSTHDTASAVVAAPLDGQTPYISSGTWSLLGVEQDTAHTDAAARDSNYSNEGTFGCHFRLQINIMGLWMIQQVRHELKDAYSFDELEKQAQAVELPARFDVNDHRFLAPESMIGAIEETVGRKLSVGELARAILENLAQSYAASLRALEQLTGKTYETLNIIGGGSKDAFLNDLTKRYTGKRIITGPTEGTAIGNLVMQMIGAGDLADIPAGRRMIRNSFDIKQI